MAKNNKPLKSAMKKQGQPTVAGDAQKKNGNGKRPSESTAHFKKNTNTNHANKKAKLDTKNNNNNSNKKSVKITDTKPSSQQQQQQQKNKPKPRPKVKKVEAIPENAKFEDFRIVAGTYHNVLYGIDAYWNEDKTLRMEPVFAFAAHIGCIKTLAIGGTNLASGSTDEKIQLYDLKRRKELGSLMQHTGTITTLAFHGKTHMLSGSDDGKVCVWRSKDWECLKIMKGHQKPVHSIAIHPSGKMALSVSQDKTVRLWNLLLGKQATQTKLAQEGIKVAWSEGTPAATGYAIMFDYEIGLYETATAKCVLTIKPVGGKKTRFNAMAYYKDEFIVVGCEDKTIKIYRVADGELVKTLTGHQNRIKGVSILYDIPVTPGSKSNASSVSSSSETMDILVSASSDGYIHAWNAIEAVKGGEEALQPLGMHNTDQRVTCLATQRGIWKNIGVQSATNEEESSEDEDNDEQEDATQEDSEDEEDSNDEDEDEE